MKSEHRHELKTNELADWIAHFPEWSKKNARTITGTVAVVLFVVAVYTWRGYSKSVAAPRRQVELTQLLENTDNVKSSVMQNNIPGQNTSARFQGAADDLETFAQRIGSGPMAAMAYLQRGKALRAELHYSSAGIVTQETIEGKIQQAQESYREAEKQAADDPSIRAAAKYGIGLCYEELSQQAEAQKVYEEILTDEALAGTAGQQAALHRLDVMYDYTTQVSFPPAPEPVVSESVDATPIETPVINLDVPQIAPVPATEATDSNASGG